MPVFPENADMPIIDTFQQNLMMKQFFNPVPVPMAPMPEFMG
jgi:hypothetical protein